MFKTLRNAWNQPELRRKLLVTVIILILYRLGTAIPVPYFVSQNTTMFEGSGNILQFFNILSGQALSNGTLFCLGVSPYITSSIVMQLLTVAIPKLGEKAKQGEEGKKFINFWTRIVTVLLAIITALGYAITQFANGNTIWGVQTAIDTWPEVWAAGVMVVCYCAGAAIVMWLAEKINESGIGNGISMILFAGILTSIPMAVEELWKTVFTGGDITKFDLVGMFIVLAIIICAIGILFLIVWMSDGERRIPIQYAKRVVGRKMYGGQNTNLPIKVNMSGVMPIIFANSIVSVPSLIVQMFNMNQAEGFAWFVMNWFSPNTWPYLVVFFLLLLAFAYFYVAISFDPVEVGNNIKNNGGAILGIRPGAPTISFIKKVLNRITLLGALLVAVVACAPMIAGIIFAANGMGLTSIAVFGGSSMMIVVGVAIETMRDLEAQLSLRNYKGFLD